MMIGLVAVCAVFANGQRRAADPIVGADDRDDQHLSSMEEEMRAKREIEAANKAHKENLNRARNLVSLSESLVKIFEEKKQLDRDELKKLEKAEKLVKGIREAAGGSDQEVELKDPPGNLGAALCKLSELSESLKSRVEKTPKRVVSAAIIDEANVLLELIRVVRTLQTRA
jgi:hypothetical protein